MVAGPAARGQPVGSARVCYRPRVPPMPGTGEVLLIVLLVVIVFFGEKVGALGDAIGRARKEFRRAQSEDDQIKVRKADPEP